MCSHWTIAETEMPAGSAVPCVICLHGNSSCRLEAMNNLTVTPHATIPCAAAETEPAAVMDE